MTDKMTAQKALEEMDRLTAAFEAAVVAAEAHANKYGLTFYIEGRGRYTGAGTEGPEWQSSSVACGHEEIGWNSSACW